jgi:hypothetical protein
MKRTLFVCAYVVEWKQQSGILPLATRLAGKMSVMKFWKEIDEDASYRQRITLRLVRRRNQSLHRVFRSYTIPRQVALMQEVELLERLRSHALP